MVATQAVDVDLKPHVSAPDKRISVPTGRPGGYTRFARKRPVRGGRFRNECGQDAPLEVREDSPGRVERLVRLDKRPLGLSEPVDELGGNVLVGEARRGDDALVVHGAADDGINLEGGAPLDTLVKRHDVLLAKKAAVRHGGHGSEGALIFESSDAGARGAVAETGSARHVRHAGQRILEDGAHDPEVCVVHEAATARLFNKAIFRGLRCDGLYRASAHHPPSMRVIIVVASLVLAGCAAAPDSGPGDERGPDASPPEPTTATWAGCEQWHLHFDARAEDFARDVPDGFDVAADETGLTTLFFQVTFCPQVQEALLTIPVVAPAEHEDPNRTETAVVQVFHGGQGKQMYPEPFSARLVEATFERDDAGTGPTLTIEGGGETTSLAVTLSPSSGAFGAERWVRFAENDAGLGVATADGSKSTNVGAGTVAYMHGGPGGAPSATAGIAHLVDDLVIEFTMEVRK